MCSDPQTNSDGVTYACRACDQCIAVDRAEWVSRGMMEKTKWRHATVLALTYSDETQEGRDGARMFNYSDVILFLKRLRFALHKHAPGEKLRFLCAGEQGARNGRCHWHMVIYSNVRLTDLGVCRRMLGGVLSETKDPKELYSVGSLKIRVSWSNWPLGFVAFQEGDVGGLHYVLSYCLKERFGSERSKHTSRVLSSEPFSAGKFRMSKRPAIGEDFLWEKFHGWLDRGICPVSLDWKVPDMPGFYHPSGRFRRIILSALNSMNKRHYWATGSNLPGWSTLLATYSSSPSTLEALNGTSQTPIEHITDERLVERIATSARKAQYRWVEQRTAEVRRRCGAVVPCSSCLRQNSQENREFYGVEFNEFGEFTKGYEKWLWDSVSQTGWCNVDCRLYESVDRRAVFADHAEQLDVRILPKIKTKFDRKKGRYTREWDLDL